MRPSPGFSAPSDNQQSPPARPRRIRQLIWAERLAWSIAAVCLTTWAVFVIAGWAGARSEVRLFKAVHAAGPQDVAAPDLSLWSEPRIRAWRESLKDHGRAPLAVLRIPHLHLEVPVLEGTDDWTLNRGAGHIEDTPKPGEDGNSGIAGHRDGFFRVLKDIAVGDALTLDTHQGTDTYRVERIWIVDPDDVSVLDRTSTRAVTLVTCYPFYFIGSAPQRYIVRAVRSSPAGHP